MKDALSKVMSLKEACKRIGIKESTMRVNIRNGKFKKGEDCVKIGNSWIFKKESLIREYPSIELGLLRGEYNKEKYPTLIEPKDLNDNSNLVGYIPADPDLENPPRLIIDKDMVLGLFRGYYYTNMESPVNSELSIYPKDLINFKSPVDLVNILLTIWEHDERYFTDSEIEIIDLWFEETSKIYGVDKDTNF